MPATKQQAYDPEPVLRDARQRVIKRNWRFTVLPGVVLAILLVILAFELIRANKGGHPAWPWNISLLGVGPAGQMALAVASLMLARAQYARSVRPYMAWSTQHATSVFLKTDAWVLNLMNTGPGIGHLESLRFSVTTNKGAHQRTSLSSTQLTEFLTTQSLQPGHDFFIQLLGPGLPLPIVKQASEGIEVAAFTTTALQNIKHLDVVVVVSDTLGDKHEKSLPFMATLPPGYATLPAAATARAGTSPMQPYPDADDD